MYKEAELVGLVEEALQIVDAKPKLAMDFILANQTKTQAALQDALNKVLCESLIERCGFSEVAENADVVLRYNAMDLWTGNLFEPMLWEIEEDIQLNVAGERIKSSPDMVPGSTGRFLEYLYTNPTAGMEFPIAHPASQGYSPNGHRCCLYVKEANKGGRRLSMAMLNHSGFQRKDRRGWWIFCGKR